MSAQLLIYKNAVPVSKERHGDWSIEVKPDFSYANKLNLLPLLATEFIAASREYPIVFSQNENSIQPVALLGMKNEQNVYIDDKGNWTAKYIPAFLRRYPFVFGKTKEANQFNLCIDESFHGIDKKGKTGKKLFGEDGEISPYTSNVLKFLQIYQNDDSKTQSLCSKLKSLDLLEPQNAHWTAANGEKATLTGFSCLSRDKLKSLTAKDLTELVKNNEMELLYAHLLSLSNFQNFSQPPRT